MRAQRFAALQYGDFRLYWIGHVISVSGQQMLWMLEPWLIYELSGSRAYLGVNALAQAVPATALVLLGGVIADKFDQRKLLIRVQSSYVFLLCILAALAFTGLLEVWHIFVISFIQSAAGSFENPARQAMFPHLIPREAMPNAVALNAAIHPATRIGGPVASGFILALVLGATDSARIAAGTVWLIAIAGIAAYVVILARIRLPPINRARGEGVLDNMVEGMRFIWHNRVFAFLIGLAYYSMFFGNSLGILFPVIAKDSLHVGPDVLGVMWGALGLGNLVGVIVASNLSAPTQQRRMLVSSLLVLGVSMIGFALTPIYWLSLVMLFVLGTGGSVLNVGLQQNLQMLVPNEFRGRVMGLWGIVHSSVRPLGEMQFSGIAAVATAPFSLIFNGAMVIAAAGFFGVHDRPTRQLVQLRKAAAVETAQHSRPAGDHLQANRERT